MSNSTISIPLSKMSKYAGLYTAIVDECDSDIAQSDWFVQKNSKAEYAFRSAYNGEKRTTLYLHRAIMSKIVGRKLENSEDVDHINGDGLDNRRCNLRIATRSQNMMNMRLPSNNTSGFKGVSWSKKAHKFKAYIQLQGKSYHLGYFNDPADAHAAYCEAAKLHFGEYARYE